MKRIVLALLAVLLISIQPCSYAADDKVDPMAVAVAHDLLVAMRFKFTLAAELKTAADNAPGALRRMAGAKLAADKSLDAAARAKMVASIDKKLPAADLALEKLFDDPATAETITNETAKLYTRYFTIDEMTKIAAFYRTPEGAKMLALAPRILTESLALGQTFMVPRTEKILDELMQPPAK
ncbi:MAG TPA: DUF2059 domain-containing protein [Telluria sp.]|nr:DUF2059 domain-containing protein [Telluria sp.]